MSVVRAWAVVKDSEGKVGRLKSFRGTGGVG